MKVFVVILNFNGKDFILDCLTSLQDIKKPPDAEVSLIVVDNASSDGSPIAIKKEFSEVILLENKQNLGFAEGNNVGIRYALKNGADYVMLLNPDTIVDQDLLVSGESRFRSAESDPQIGIVGPKIYFAPGYEFHKERYTKEKQGKVIWFAGGQIDWQNILSSHRGVDEVDEGQYDKVEETDFVTGCCLLVKKEVLEKIGLFDPRYFLYWEDIDFCWRAKKAGFKIVFAPQAHLWHLNAGSSSVGGDLHDYYLTRNRMLFGMRYAPIRAKLALIRESFKILITGRKWQKRGVWDFYLGKFGKGSYSS